LIVDEGKIVGDENIAEEFNSFFSRIYRVYKKKLNRYEFALNFAKQLLISSPRCI
jgi:hypothetical protein